MNKITSINKLTLWVIFAIHLPCICFSQSLQPPLTASPNASSLEKFTELPVNLFTGTPDISIPIHTLKYGNINVPIALRYNPALVKPGQQPGWVGLGWNLQSFGAITRTVRYYADDLYGDPGNINTEPTNAANAYYPVPGNSANFTESGSELANDADWDTQTHLVNNYQVNSKNTTGVNDMEADEFSFNFMGYSGTFYYSGPTLGWQVVSNDNIKVTLNGFLKPSDILTAIGEFQPFQQQICNNCSVLDGTYQPNTFSGFTITVPDGTQYVFGGINATEFESVLWYGTGYFQFLANTWLLSKIIDVNKNEVDFTYQRTYPTCNMNFRGFSESVVTASTNGSLGCSVKNATYNTADTTIHSGKYEWPMYLSTITSPNETVSFSISPATCLRFPNFMILSNDGSNVSKTAGPIVPTPAYADMLAPSPVNGTLDNIQWEQLNDISISNSANSVYRQYHFNYSNSPSQRLTLNSLSENDNVNSPVETYSFQYNNVANMSALATGGLGVVYYDGNATDSWGYYNGENLNGVNASGMAAARQAYPYLVTTGLLTQITYPTGGYTQLTWEANDYSQVVSLNRQSLNSATGYAGGSRIKEIKSFDTNGAVLLDKNYIYKAGYTAGGNLASLPSSGVLNGIPQYSFSATGRQSVSGNTTVSIYAEAFQPLTTYSYNGLNSFIGYSEVAEVNADGSYTRHFFTNYGADLNGVSHFDLPPSGAIGWVLGGTMDAYLPMNALDGERGKPTGIFQYTSGNTLVEKTQYTYRNDAARFNSYIKLVDFNNLYECNASDAVIFESAREQYTYDYYPVTKTVTVYNQQGTNPTASSESYTYNVNNLISTKTTTNSQGQTEVTHYTYPTDLTDATSEAMVNAHILSPVIQTSITNSGSQVSLTKVNYYSPYSNYFLPQTLQIQNGNNSIETRQQVYNYDTHGNVTEESQTDGRHDVYLWGYNSQYLVARITNSTLSSVQSVMAAHNITQTQLDNAATSTDAAMRTLLNTLRTNLPNSQVTTYTYAPVIGVTSETDPKGQLTLYEYDSYGRLQNIKDLNGNIIKHYDYHYQGQ